MFDNLSRRDVLKMLAVAPAVGASRLAGVASAQTPAPAPPKPLEIGVVSRHLQFTNMEEAIAISKEIGFDSIEWNVRNGGHVTPEKVERDLPRCVQLTQQAGLTVPMITTSIADANSPHAEAILATASGLGVTHYRAEGLRYDYTKDLEAQLEALKPRFAAINTLNTKYKIAIAYHTHSSGGTIGGNIWDLWVIMKQFDPTYLGLNYDTGHATRRGGAGMVDGLHIAHKYIRALALKDFKYTVNPQTGTVGSAWTPTGEGQVNFKQVFDVLKAKGWRGPINIHYEHNGLLGTSVGQYQLAMPVAQFKTIIKRDLDHIRGVMRDARI